MADTPTPTPPQTARDQARDLYQDARSLPFHSSARTALLLEALVVLGIGDEPTDPANDAAVVRLESAAGTVRKVRTRKAAA
jgi:hypothetical protein